MKVFIRTVTYHWVGDLQLGRNNIEGIECVTLKPAWWIADSGLNLAERIKNADYEEMEYFPDGVMIATQSVVDMMVGVKLPE